jgi:hypothetical protein
MIYNGELRYEHYLKNSNYHLGVFYKQINNPVVAKSNGSNSYSFVNMERALVYGSEFEFNQTFKFRKGHFIDNIQLIGNLSFNFSSLFEKVKGTDGADSIRKLTKSMVGQSPYIANIQLSAYFRKKKGHVTLNGFYQGNRVLFAGDEVFFYSLIQRTGVQLSFTSSYELSESTSLRFKVDACCCSPPADWTRAARAHSRQIGRARRALTASKLDARGARPVHHQCSRQSLLKTLSLPLLEVFPHYPPSFHQGLTTYQGMNPSYFFCKEELYLCILP